MGERLVFRHELGCEPGDGCQFPHAVCSHFPGGWALCCDQGVEIKRIVVPTLAELAQPSGEDWDGLRDVRELTSHNAADPEEPFLKAVLFLLHQGQMGSW